MNQRTQLYLAGLLHDIGKFRQRASSIRDPLTHAEHSAGWINDCLSDKVVAQLAAFHHADDLRSSPLQGEVRFLAELLCEADNLASLDRSHDPHSEQRFLRSIFSGMTLGETPRRCEAFQPLCIPTPLAYRFPQQDQAADTAQYDEHWNAFDNEAAKVEPGDHTALFFLLKKYMWCIPAASYHTIPDVSLFEHSRLTAAIALCMHDYFAVDASRRTERVSDRSMPRYLLAGADITGIQRFIYNIGHRRALKALKGRSFLLEHVLEVVADTIIRRMDLFEANIIYATGGKCYVLLPNTARSRDTLQGLQGEVERQLMEAYGGDIGIVVDFIELSGSDFGQNKVADRWHDLSVKLDRAKSRKFLSLVREPGFFDPRPPSGDVVTCHNTGRYLCAFADLGQEYRLRDEYTAVDTQTDGRVYKLPKEEDEDISTAPRYISREQYEAIRAGSMLKHGAASITVYGDSPSVQDDRLSILASRSIVINEQEECSGVPMYRYALEPDHFLDVQSSGRKGWRMYGGPWAMEGSFEEVVASAVGIRRMGMLRMDADNLGLLFRRGLGSGASFSRIVQLSSMVGFFFSGYVNRLKTLHWDSAGINEDRRGTPLKDVMEIVYSGGDDLCIIGVWNVLPDVALWIRESFRRYTTNHPDFTLSAGIVLFESGQPVSKAALMAGDAEARAKGSRTLRDGTSASKDAVTLFGVTTGWDDFARISEDVRKYYGLIMRGKDGSRLPRSILRHLASICATHDQEGRPTWGRWRWLACYSLARFGEREKAMKDEIDELAADVITSRKTKQEYMTLLPIITQWLEYLTREV